MTDFKAGFDKLHGIFKTSPPGSQSTGLGDTLLGMDSTTLDPNKVSRIFASENQANELAVDKEAASHLDKDNT